RLGGVEFGSLLASIVSENTDIWIIAGLGDIATQIEEWPDPDEGCSPPDPPEPPEPPIPEISACELIVPVQVTNSDPEDIPIFPGARKCGPSTSFDSTIENAGPIVSFRPCP